MYLHSQGKTVTTLHNVPTQYNENQVRTLKVDTYDELKYS